MTSDDGGDSDEADAIPARGSTPVRVIDTVRQLVMQGGVTLRAIPRVRQIFVSPGDPAFPRPSEARWWLPRWGLFALREPLTIAADGDSLRGRCECARSGATAGYESPAARFELGRAGSRP